MNDGMLYGESLLFFYAILYLFLSLRCVISDVFSVTLSSLDFYVFINFLANTVCNQGQFKKSSLSLFLRKA